MWVFVYVTEDSDRGDPSDALSLNLYSYVSNNPLVYWDPSGHTKAGDDKLSQKTQNYITQLTYLYNSTSDPAYKKEIAAEADKARASDKATGSYTPQAPSETKSTGSSGNKSSSASSGKMTAEDQTRLAILEEAAGREYDMYGKIGGATQSGLERLTSEYGLITVLNYSKASNNVQSDGGSNVQLLANVTPAPKASPGSGNTKQSQVPAPTIGPNDVPIAEYMAHYGISVSWRPETKTVSVYYYGRSELFEASEYKIVNGKMYVDKNILNKKFGLTDVKYDIKDFNCKSYAYGITDRDLLENSGATGVTRVLADNKDISLSDGAYLVAYRMYNKPKDSSFHYMKQDPVTGAWWGKGGVNPIEFLGWINPDDNGNWVEFGPFTQTPTTYQIVTGVPFWSK